MKNFQIFSITILGICFIMSLASFCKIKNQLQLIDATSQYSPSGMNGGTNSTEYYFKIKVLTDEKIDFDSIWIGKKVFKPYLANNEQNVSSQLPSFLKNDTILLRISDLSSKTNSMNSIPPIKYKGAALMRYRVKNKVAYMYIEKIETKTGINRP